VQRGIPKGNVISNAVGKLLKYVIARRVLSDEAISTFLPVIPSTPRNPKNHNYHKSLPGKFSISAPGGVSIPCIIGDPAAEASDNAWDFVRVLFENTLHSLVFQENCCYNNFIQVLFG